MAASKVEQQVTWSSADTISLSTNNWFVSDEMTLNDADWDGMISARADNSGTPASGDTVEVRALFTSGDLDNGGGGNDYPNMNTSGTTGAGAPLLGMLDTYVNIDPDNFTVPFELSGKKYKIAARAKQGATRAITLAVRLVTRRDAVA